MNLATVALTLYLRNPTQRSVSNDPMIILPNGKRIVIQIIDCVPAADKPFNTYTIFRVCREFRSLNGTSMCRIGDDCYDLEAVAKILAQENDSRRSPQMNAKTWRFYPDRR